MEIAERGFRNARAQGVTIGCGSDVGPFPHGTNVRELSWMVRLGMTPGDALAAATSVNAKILGKENELGSIRRGYFADLIAVTGQPDKNIGALANPSFIMKNGAVVSRMTGG
jgi:imidazolonepropionase-like amidohydrolase